MATIDPSIALGVRPIQVEQPMNQLAKVLQIRGMQQESELGRMKMDEYRRGIEDQNALRSALSQPGADPYNVLLQRGKVKDATDYLKGKADVGKTEAETQAKKLEIAKNRVNLAGQAFGSVRANPTLENAHAVLDYLGQNGVYSPEQVAQYKQQTAANPGAIAQLADQAFRAALDAKEQLDKIQTNNIGGQTLTQSIDPVTGKAATVSAIQNTQSPDNAASNARMAADAAAGRTVTMRGQDMTDQRQRDANAIAAGKPSAATEKELVGIRQQNSIIDGALAAVEKTPDAFSLSRGMATMAGALPESIAGRFDSDAQRQARSYVFNNVSKVINERAGAAQSAQELARLRSFLPAETDNADQIKSKLQAFKTYLSDMEAGTKGGAQTAAPPAGGKTMSMADVEATAKASGRSVEEVKKAAQAKGYTVR